MLVINNLTKIYKNRKQEKLALDNVSLELGDGVHALLGPNGAGKSTLMKLITCNLKSEDGQIKWKDKDGKEKEIEAMGAEYRSLIGYAPQQQGLYEAFTGYRFLQYMAVLKDIPKKQMDEEIKRVADSVNLSDVLDNRINAYSGGMKQRLLVAQALLGNPKLLIFDEPTVGLDPKERVRFRELLLKLKKDKTILLSSHIVTDINNVADRVIMLKMGKMVLDSKVKDTDIENKYMEFFND